MERERRQSSGGRQPDCAGARSSTGQDQGHRQPRAGESLNTIRQFLIVPSTAPETPTLWLREVPKKGQKPEIRAERERDIGECTEGDRPKGTEEERENWEEKVQREQGKQEEKLVE